MINKIISDCLVSSKRVVVPQFGAFIHKEGDGVVVFVSFLKKDDGVLSSQIRSSLGISQVDADEMIAEYVAEIKRNVEKRGSFLIEGLGFIKGDSNGLYYLVYNPNTGLPVDAPSSVSSVNSASVENSAPKVTPVQPSSTVLRSSMAQEPVKVPQVVEPKPQPIRTMQSQTPEPERTEQPRPTQPREVSQGVPKSTMQSQPTQPQPQPHPQPIQRQPVRPAPTANVNLAQGSVVPPKPQAAPSGSAQPVRPQAGQVQGQPQSQGQTKPQSLGQPQRPLQQQQQQSPVRPQQVQGVPQPNVAPRAPQGRRPMPPQRPQTDSDKFMIIAILAAIIAVAAIAYGLLSSDGGPDMEQIMRSVEQAQDTVMVNTNK